MTTDEDVERVAEALWNAAEGGGQVAWSETNDWWRSKQRRLAVAAIAAMRPAEAEEDDGSGDWMGGPIG